MIKIRVDNEIDDIKIQLLPIKNEICIVHNRKVKDDYIITFDNNLEFISNHLSVTRSEDFNDEKRLEFIVSDDDVVIIGRKDFLD